MASQSSVPTVTIIGLKEKYRINEPLEFSIIIKGVLRGGGFPCITITKVSDTKDKIYSMAFMSPEPPTALSKYIEQKLSFPREDDPQAPIQAKEAGIYTLTASVNVDMDKPYEVIRKIVVE